MLLFPFRCFFCLIGGSFALLALALVAGAFCNSFLLSHKNISSITNLLILSSIHHQVGLPFFCAIEICMEVFSRRVFREFQRAEQSRATAKLSGKQKHLNLNYPSFFNGKLQKIKNIRSRAGAKNV